MDAIRRLRIRAEAADVVHEGLLVRGPIWSRPAWEAEVAAASAASREAWVAYADALLGPMGGVPSITDSTFPVTQHAPAG